MLWLLDELLLKGTAGAHLPLWPGWLPALFILLASAAAYTSLLRVVPARDGGRQTAILAGLAPLCFGLIDWALLAALPRLGLSYGPLTIPLASITAVRLGVFTLVIRPLFWLAQRANGIPPAHRLARAGLAALWLANLGILALEIYGLYFEPFNLRTSQVHLAGPGKDAGAPLRILHLSDLHIERITRRERELIQQSRALQPDLIVLTGDYANVDYLDDPHTWQDIHNLLSQLSAPLGVYAVTGTVDTPEGMRETLQDTSVELLDDEARRIETGGETIYLAGVSNLQRNRDAQVLRSLMSNAPEGAYKILLYHTPDLIETAEALQVDLYLAGHTHGGQVRLPFYGALVTLSAYGKQFESGLYQLNPTTLYVSRGLGMEGWGLPRARFLCPPEMVLLELDGGAAP
jgi:hypothetical protein